MVVPVLTYNGPEFIGKTMDQWAYLNRVGLDFIDPGKPQQNGHIESFNGKFRHECLNEHWFVGLGEARRLTAAYAREYNTDRPHSSLGNRTPQEFAAAWAAAPSPPRGIRINLTPSRSKHPRGCPPDSRKD
jgi:putative transposase